MNLTERQALYDKFLERWPEEAVRTMSLSSYVDVENHDTFCYWVERETRLLGSILGSPAIKFGIYKRKSQKEPVAQYSNDSEYSWRPIYGSSRGEAFEKIRNQILKIIDFSQKGAFSELDEIQLSSMFKWKIAFMYSNERLIPIYEEKTLRRISESFGSQQGREIRISEIQELMMANKPAELDIYQYMGELWYQFSNKNSKENERENLKKSNKNAQSDWLPARRRSASDLNTASKTISISRTYVIEQKHKKLQLLLREKLEGEFGAENVRLEEDFVDLKLLQPQYITLYEVKSSSYPVNCVREAIGQLLYYSICDEDSRPKRLVVVGQFPPNASEEEFIMKLRQILNVDISYQYLSLK